MLARQPTVLEAVSIRVEDDLALSLTLVCDRSCADYLLGDSLFESNDPALRDAAIYSYIMAHVLRPQAAAYINLGVLLRRTGRKKAALAAFERAVRLTPHEPAAYRNLASMLPTAAVPLLKTAVTLSPADGSVHLALAGALQTDGGRPDESAAHFGIALRLAPSLAGGSPTFGNWRSWWPSYRQRRNELLGASATAGVDGGIRYQVALQFPFTAVELLEIASSQSATVAAAAAVAASDTDASSPRRTAPDALSMRQSICVVNMSAGGVGGGRGVPGSKRRQLRCQAPLQIAYVGALSDEPQLRAMTPIFEVQGQGGSCVLHSSPASALSPFATPWPESSRLARTAHFQSRGGVQLLCIHAATRLQACQRCNTSINRADCHRIQPSHRDIAT